MCNYLECPYEKRIAKLEKQVGLPLPKDAPPNLYYPTAIERIATLERRAHEHAIMLEVQPEATIGVKVVAEPKPEPKLTPVDLDALRNEISNAIAGRTPSIGLALLPHFFMAINLVFAKYQEGNK